MTEKYMEEASRERHAKGWFEKRGCTRSNKMERRHPDDNYDKHLATSVDGDKTGLKLETSSKYMKLKAFSARKIYLNYKMLLFSFFFSMTIKLHQCSFEISSL